MLTKYASLESVEVLNLFGSGTKVRHASLGKLADFQEYRTKDQFLYARIRAISSRCNKNNDGWPSIELAGGQDIFDRHTASTEGFTVTADTNRDYGFSTFLGKPIFVDHHNSDPKRARGVIVDAKFHVDDHRTASLDPYYSSKEVDPEHLPASWVELLLEIDAKSFPKFAKAVIEGARNPHKGIDGWSMGCDVERSVCSICKNSASTPEDYCKHVRLKGAYFDSKDPDTGQRISKKAYENCYGVKFFEISGVFDPADETALSREVRSSVYKEAGYTKLAENPKPQSDLSRAPEHVDTLREESICPVCGSSMDEDTCDVCGYQEPPKGFDNPDLTKAQQTDHPEAERDDPRTDAPKEDPNEGAPVDTATSLTPNNPPTVAHVRQDMSNVQTKTAAPLNKVERPLVNTDKPQSNEPEERVLQDQTRPVTSNVRTAREFLAAIGASRRNNMNHTAEAASGVPADAKPDVRTTVDGVGGVDQDSNEAASKADAQVDVLGVGGTGVEGVAADKEGVKVDQGDEHSKNIQGTDTQTWHGTEGNKVQRQESPVTRETPWYQDNGSGFHASNWHLAYDDSPFPEGEDIAGGKAKTGVKPIAEQFGERQNLFEHPTSPENNSGPTTTWTGTDGNGVTRQQDPVTKDSIALSESGLDGSPNWGRASSTHIFAAFKLAETEVELGLIAPDQKYERAAELEQADPSVVTASLDYATKVKSAAIQKRAALQKLPVMGSNPNVTKEASTDSTVKSDDSFMFGGL